MKHVGSTLDPEQYVQPEGFYRCYYACCNANDFARLDEFVIPTSGSATRSGGLVRYQHRLEAVVGVFLAYRCHLDGLLGDGDWLAARFTDRGTHLEWFLGIGRPVAR